MKSAYDYSALSSVEGELLPREDVSTVDQFPGERRRSLPAATALTADRIFVKTAGNALQAVPRAHLEAQNLMAVTVPEISQPGDEILVRTPDGQRLIRAAIPADAVAGQVLLVRVPPAVAATGLPLDASIPSTSTSPENASGVTEVIAGEDVEKNDLTLQEAGPSSSNGTTEDQSNLMLVQVPFGALPGSKMNVKVPDGRTIEAIIPDDPSIKEFFLRIPPKTDRSTLPSLV